MGYLTECENLQAGRGFCARVIPAGGIQEPLWLQYLLAPSRGSGQPALSGHAWVQCVHEGRSQAKGVDVMGQGK